MSASARSSCHRVAADVIPLPRQAAQALVVTLQVFRNRLSSSSHLRICGSSARASSRV